MLLSVDLIYLILVVDFMSVSTKYRGDVLFARLSGSRDSALPPLPVSSHSWFPTSLTDREIESWEDWEIISLFRGIRRVILKIKYKVWSQPKPKLQLWILLEAQIHISEDFKTKHLDFIIHVQKWSFLNIEPACLGVHMRLSDETCHFNLLICISFCHLPFFSFWFLHFFEI